MILTFNTYFNMKNLLQLRYVHTFILVLFCIFISSTFSACNNDDSAPEPKSEDVDFLVGTWIYQFGEEDYCRYIFKEDGTGRAIEWDNNSIEGDDFFVYIHYPDEFRIKIIFSDDYIEDITYDKISNTRLIVYDFYDAVENWVKQ